MHGLTHLIPGFSFSDVEEPGLQQSEITNGSITIEPEQEFESHLIGPVPMSTSLYLDAVFEGAVWRPFLVDGSTGSYPS